MNSLVLREARPEDAELILEFVRELAVFERLRDQCVADAGLFRRFLFEDKRASAVMAEWEGAPAGFALYFYNFSTFLGRPGLYLEDLFVKPEKRGKGYGRALLVELAEIARDRGCGRMEWAVLDWNEPAIEFYRALGATPLDEWTVFRLTRDGIEKLAKAADTAATTKPVEND